jgi:hypothetical protein
VHGLNCPGAVQIAERARLLNVHADEVALGSLEAYIPDIPLDEVIRIVRPGGQEPDGEHSAAWYSAWLGRWTAHWILDDVVRSRALEIARSALLICRTEHP